MTVSPDLARPTSLMPAIRYPTSPGPSSSTGPRLGRPDPDLLDLARGPRLHEEEARLRPQHSVHDANRADDTAVLVVGGVEDESPKRRSRGRPTAAGTRSTTASSKLAHPGSGLRRDVQDRRCVDPEHPLDLVGVTLGIRRGQVDLVERRDDLQCRARAPGSWSRGSAPGCPATRRPAGPLPRMRRATGSPRR